LDTPVSSIPKTQHRSQNAKTHNRTKKQNQLKIDTLIRKKYISYSWATNIRIPTCGCNMADITKAAATKNRKYVVTEQNPAK
jgi:hypothetical protein